jgi:hypothetical protein
MSPVLPPATDGDLSVTNRPTARHKAAVERTVRSLASRKRLLRLVMPAAAAAIVTASVVGVAVTRSQHEAVEGNIAAKPVEQNVPLGGRDESVYRAERVKEFSRSADRVTLREKPDVKDHEYRTAALNLWPAPREKGKPLDVLPSGGKVAVTGLKKAGFAQILYGGQVRWVHAEYLSEKKPVPESDTSSSDSSGSSGAVSTAGVSTAPCPDGSGTESGLTPSAVTLFRAVCNAFPALTTYGGYSAHGEHASGRAIDFMVSDSGLGQQVADWARAHAGELNLYDVIWQQHIWTPERSSEGWRSMPDRGSPTANHFDHVHISVN